MAKISLGLDSRSKKNCMQLIRLKVTNRGTSAYVGTGVYVEPQYFRAGSLYDPIHGKAYMAVEKREQLRMFVKRWDNVMAAIGTIEMKSLTAADIKERVMGEQPQTHAQVHIEKSAHAQGDFLKWFEQYGESRRTPKTQESYAYGLKVLKAYCEARRLWTLSIGEIDYARVSDFGRWLGESKGDATRHMLESYVRAAYKEAQKCRMVSRDIDPYLDYSIKPVPQREIDCLTAKQMHTLMTAELPTKGMQWGRDLAMMSFYLCGANLLDLYEMQEPTNGEVVFVRHKIEGHDRQSIHIRIEPELRALLDRYKGDGQMLHFKATYANYESFRHKIGHRLREVSREIGFDVNMAKVRRTWATIAGSLRIEELVIDKSMGHVVRTVTASHYEKYDWSRTAEANRKVIDAVTKSA